MHSERLVRVYALSTTAINDEWKRVGGSREAFDVRRVLRAEEVDAQPLGESDVRVRVLIVSAEYNVVHAALADVVDIAAAHGGKHYPGNSFLGEVVEVGPHVSNVRPGDVVVPSGTSVYDAFGYPQRTWGFDDSRRGCYAEEVVLPASMLHHAPLRCGLNLWQIAVLPLRAGNAYHMWRRAHDVFRAKVPRERLAYLNVMAFGGGVSELFLMMAHAEGHDAVYCAATAARRAHMESLGIRTIDQKEFNRFATDADIRRFGVHIRRITCGANMNIVCDMFRGRVFEAGLVAMAKQGVNISSGWQLDTNVNYNSSLLSLKQITLDHAHVETSLAAPAVASLFGRVLRPLVHPRIYSFAELPEAIDDACHGRHEGFAAIQVAARLPQQLLALAGGKTAAPVGQEQGVVNAVQEGSEHRAVR
jgi:NADPH:quinone reductase-like Zn-dependent oxidoreductase